MPENFPAAPPPDVKSFITLEAGKAELTPEIARNTVLALEAAMLRVPDAYKQALETMHHFAEGTYCRTVFMHAGSMITGKIHKLEHTVIISQGSASVYSEEFGTKVLHAPQIFVSPPGAKRVLFIHEDMIWTTVHKNPSNTRDLRVLESELMSEEYIDTGSRE